ARSYKSCAAGILLTLPGAGALGFALPQAGEGNIKATDYKAIHGLCPSGRPPSFKFVQDEFVRPSPE
ncbi:MAG TPA: hypothetical protein VFH52_10420, partial [Rhodanobacteraceae bacterium]|nr:hypothetical protein [Rhodanobacteraceae bacterium]